MEDVYIVTNVSMYNAKRLHGNEKYSIITPIRSIKMRANNYFCNAEVPGDKKPPMQQLSRFVPSRECVRRNYSPNSDQRRDNPEA